MFDKQVGVCGGEGFCDRSNHEPLGVKTQGESTFGTSQDEVRCRSERGEFEKAIRDFESIPEKQYDTCVEAPIPLVHDSGNKSCLFSEADLYVYAGGVDLQNFFYVCTL